MMNLPTLIILLLLAVALFFALRSYLRAGSCGCNSGGSDGVFPDNQRFRTS